LDARWPFDEPYFLPATTVQALRRAQAAGGRVVVEAVLYRYRAGIPWRDLPERFGDFRVVHLRHSRRSKSWVWERTFKTLSQDPDNEYVMIDPTIVRAHPHSSGAKGGLRKSKPTDEVEGA
jgi:transposase